MFPECKIPNDAARLYTQAVKKTEKLMLPLLTCMKRVGQAQLLKKMISTELQFKSRLDANLLFQAVNTLDMNIMIDLKEDLRDPSKEGMVKEENPLLGGLSQLLETSGNYDVFSKIFITSVPLEGLPVLLMLFVVSYIGKMEYDPDFGSLVRVKGAPLDGYLLKKMISTELQFKSRLDANLLFQAVNTLDMNIMIDLKEDLRDPSKEGMVKEENPLLGGLSQLLETSGNYDVFSKIFITSVPLEGLPVLLMLFVVSYIGKMEYDPDFGSLVRVKGAPLDGYPLVSGMATLLKQFHPSYGTSCIGYLGQFIRSTVHGVLGEREGKEGLGGDVRGKEGGRGGLPREVSTCMVFSQQLASTMGVDAGALSRHVPDFLINCVN